MKKIYILAAASLALAACSNNDDINSIDEPIEAKISASIGISTGTRTSGSSWSNGDAIGITMDGRYYNLKYATPAGDGKFNGTAMYFLNKRDPVNITAYYPFKGEEGSDSGVIQATTGSLQQAEDIQHDIDFLFAGKENVTGANPEVNFEFSHRMSQVTLTFKKGNDGTDVSKIISYEIEGLIMDGSFNTLTGDCAADDASEPETLKIDLAEGTVVNGIALPSVIIFPQTADNDQVTLKITDSLGQEYSCKLNFKDNRLASGNNYQWTIIVNKTELSIGNFTISDWLDESSETGAGSVLQ